jgi:hypothetical protein
VKLGAKMLDRFAPLTRGFAKRHRIWRNRKETVTLIEEANAFIERRVARNSIDDVHPKHSLPIIHSPFHTEFLDGKYGGTTTRTKKLKLPQFNPASVGGLILLPGQWKCIVCSFNNCAARPIPNCAACSTTPSRHAKLTAPIYRTRFSDRKSNGSDDANSDDTGSADDGEDSAYRLADERKVALNKQVSQHGRKWRISDTRSCNRETNLKWTALDPVPIASNAASMWYTVLAPPTNIEQAQQVVLWDNARLLKKLLAPQWYAVQKAKLQIVGAWSLDRILHGVFGKRGMAAFAKHAGSTIVELPNQLDHQFDDRHRNKPVVVNTDAISGCVDIGLLQAFGFHDVPGLIRLSYLKQVERVFGTFLSKHADEFVLFAGMDSRNTLSLHAGPSPRDGTRWVRVNGRGVAIPGLRKGTLHVSEQMRKDMGQVCLFIVEILLRKMVLGTVREKQGVADEYRHSLNDLWRQYLCYPELLTSEIVRLGEALTIHIGKASLLHYDFMNDPMDLFDNISWVLNVVDDLRLYLSESSIAKCQSSGVPLENVPVTFLSYMRSILGSQALKLKGVANENCSLFRMYATQISFDFETDTERLNDATFRTKFLNLIRSERLNGLQYPKKILKEDYKGAFCILKENNNRHIFIGSFVYVWDRFISRFRTAIRYDHTIQYAAFVSRECNGSALCCDIILNLVAAEDTQEVVKALGEASPSLFELLELKYQNRRLSLPISSSSPRWQHICRPVYTTPKERWKSIIHVGFVKFCYDQINTADKIPGVLGRKRLEDAYRLFVSKESRSAKIWSTEDLKVIRYGAVRGTFAIQLGAFLMLIAAKHAGFANVDKGKSGFYKCVNEHKKGSYDHPELNTEEAQTEVDEVLRSLTSKGLRVCRAWLDQNGCRWWREQNNSLKNDLLFWDKISGHLFLQFRYREVTKGEWKIELYFEEHWREYKDYWVPYYEAKNERERLRMRRDVAKKGQLKDWVRKLGIASIHQTEWCLDKVEV